MGKVVGLRSLCLLLVDGVVVRLVMLSANSQDSLKFQSLQHRADGRATEAGDGANGVDAGWLFLEVVEQPAFVGSCRSLLVRHWRRF